MDVGLLTLVLARRAALARAERVSPESLERLRSRRLQSLRDYAAAHSTFYARHHAGLARAPLAALPAVTKADLMGHFDEVSTDPGVTLAGLVSHLDRLRREGGIPACRGWAGGGPRRPRARRGNRSSWRGTAGSGPRCSLPTPGRPAGHTSPSGRRGRCGWRWSARWCRPTRAPWWVPVRVHRSCPRCGWTRACRQTSWLRA